MVGASWKGSSQKTIRSARRAFDSFREEMAHTRPDLLWAPQEWGADLAMSLHNEVTFMCFARWLMEGGLAASTVTTYLSLTRSSLEAELGFKLLSGQETRLPRMMRALRRMFSQLRKRRCGWRASHHRLHRNHSKG